MPSTKQEVECFLGKKKYQKKSSAKRSWAKLMTISVIISSHVGFNERHEERRS